MHCRTLLFFGSIITVLASGTFAQPSPASAVPPLPTAPPPTFVGPIPAPSIMSAGSIDAINQDTQLAANVEVVFSGAQQERFLFEEGPGKDVEEKGLFLRTVGFISISMGHRAIDVRVRRENTHPENLHVRVNGSNGGKLLTTFSLTIGQERTFDLVGGPSTRVTFRRLR